MRNAKSQLSGTTGVAVTLNPNLPTGVFDVIYTKWSVIVTRGYSSNEEDDRTNGCIETRRPTIDHNMVYVPGKNLKLRPLLHSQKKVGKGVKSVKPAHLYVMPASDEDAEHTIRRAMNRRPTLDHNMVYVPGKNLKLRPFYAHKKGAKRCKRSQSSTSQLDAGVG